MKDYISIDETKASLLMVLLVVSFGFAMYQIITNGDISGNLLQLLFMLIGAVSGINIAAKFSNGGKTEVYTKEGHDESYK